MMHENREIKGISYLMHQNQEGKRISVPYCICLVSKSCHMGALTVLRRRSPEAWSKKLNGEKGNQQPLHSREAVAAKSTESRLISFKSMGK